MLHLHVPQIKLWSILNILHQSHYKKLIQCCVVMQKNKHKHISSHSFAHTHTHTHKGQWSPWGTLRVGLGKKQDSVLKVHMLLLLGPLNCGMLQALWRAKLVSHVQLCPMYVFLLYCLSAKCTCPTDVNNIVINNLCHQHNACILFKSWTVSQ